MDERILAYEKVKIYKNGRISSNLQTLAVERTTQNELRQQLDAAKNDKKAAFKELEELKRRYTQLEDARRTFTQQLDALRRERAALVKKVEAVSVSVPLPIFC